MSVDIMHKLQHCYEIPELIKKLEQAEIRLTPKKKSLNFKKVVKSKYPVAAVILSNHLGGMLAPRSRI